LASRWFVRNFAVVNLVLVSFCIISYVATIYSLEFWTYRRWSTGELGGVLDYRWLGISVVHHVVQENLETVFSFPDFTSYFLIACIIFNLATLFLSRDSDITGQHWIHIRNSTTLNVIVAILCGVFYVWWTMMYIDLKLRFTPHIGGSVTYFPAFIIAITHVYQGRFESSLNWRTFDIALWLLLVLLIRAVRIIRWNPEREQKERRNRMIKVLTVILILMVILMVIYVSAVMYQTINIPVGPP